MMMNFPYEIHLGTGISQWYSAGIRAGWSVVRVPAGAGKFPLYHRVKTGFGAHLVSCPMDTRDSFPGRKRLRREADHSPPSREEVKMRGGIPPLFQYAFMAWCSVKSSTGITLLFLYEIDLMKVTTYYFHVKLLRISVLRPVLFLK
jgi:hypothetical protein